MQHVGKTYGHLKVLDKAVNPHTRAVEYKCAINGYWVYLDKKSLKKHIKKYGNNI